MNDVLTEFLDLGPNELPSLPTPQQRTAWLLGRVTDKAPAMARPLIRSMLLPKLEQLDSESLVETLVFLQTVVLPWLIEGDLAADPYYVPFEDDDYVLAD
jgi:hypothetical protein